jgi:hypothetical protein
MRSKLVVEFPRIENANQFLPQASLTVSWDQRFNEPIPLPRGKPLVTLRDAALYITKLPKAEHDTEEWQTAMEALLLVAESDGPTMFARIGVMLALNRSKPAPTIAPRRKRAKA